MIVSAFAAKPDADGGEAAPLERLRAAGALMLSLVAVRGQQVIGQAALSPAQIGAERYLCLGPVAVLPDCQGRGVGADLIHHILSVAPMMDRAGVVVMGDPTYYGRFGFERMKSVHFDGPGADAIQVLPFGSDPKGNVAFHPAF